MSVTKDFIVYNMPAMLSRRVTKLDDDNPQVWVVDKDWFARVRERMAVLFSFYAKRDLLLDENTIANVESVILKLSDFSSLGQRFILSGASDRWLASFDRVGSKKDVNNVDYLEKQLKLLDKS